MFTKSANRKLTVDRPEGLHARPCLAIANTVRRFQSKVEINCNGQRIDAKDVLQLLSMGAGQGREIAVSATGDDCEAVIEALDQLFKNDFGLGS